MKFIKHQNATKTQGKQVKNAPRFKLVKNIKI